MSAAFPMQEPERFAVTFTRVFAVENPEFGTQIRAYAICASMSPGV
jgi:hypothetical protein